MGLLVSLDQNEEMSYSLRDVQLRVFVGNFGPELCQVVKYIACLKSMSVLVGRDSSSRSSLVVDAKRSCAPDKSSLLSRFVIRR